MAKATILLVDSSRFYLELEKAFLWRTDATVLAVESGRAAIGLLETARQVDLVYMELDLPEMDGATCCQYLKQTPIWKNVPVILIHDRERPGGDRLCREAGCDAVLEKPLDRTLFLMEGKRFLPLIDRRTLRITCRQLVVLRHGENCFCGTSADIGSGGMYVALDHGCLLQEGDILHLSFVMPGTVSDLVELTSRVAWLNQGRTRPKPTLPNGCGLEFTNDFEVGRKRIQCFVGERFPA